MVSLLCRLCMAGVVPTLDYWLFKRRILIYMKHEASGNAGSALDGRTGTTVVLGEMFGCWLLVPKHGRSKWYFVLACFCHFIFKNYGWLYIFSILIPDTNPSSDFSSLSTSLPVLK